MACEEVDSIVAISSLCLNVCAVKVLWLAVSPVLCLPWDYNPPLTGSP